MSIDMSQFHDVFFEESQEHIADMEHLLLTLSIENPDPEQLNSIFRAAHSIKGSSSVFGFDALSSLTHVMENVLDRARKNQLMISKHIVNSLLKAVDKLTIILKQYQCKQAIDWNALESDTLAIDSLITNTLSNEGVVEEFSFFEPLDEADDKFDFFNDSQVNSANSANARSEQPNNSHIYESPVESSSIRVDTVKIDALVNLVGEMVITQSKLKTISAGIKEEEEAEKLHFAISELTQNVRDIQESVMSMRMLPISFVFNRFSRVVRDLADKLEKSVRLVIEGGDTQIDKAISERLVDPLTHLIRNSIDHGLETPEKRLKKGKPETGIVKLTAERVGSSIVINIIDDGAGLDRSLIIEKARSININVSDDMSDEQVWQLIFQAGFSTVNEVTDVSGRGVGMDVVRKNIETVGGSIEITSSAHKGASFTVTLPLTLAITDGLLVSVAEQTYIVPLSNIKESFQPSIDQLKSVNNHTMLYIRGDYIPLIRLHKIMNIQTDTISILQSIVILVETNTSRFGLIVDGLLGQQQVVIKSLEQHYKRVKGVAGATILGDGRVAFILDIESIAHEVVSDSAGKSAEGQGPEDIKLEQ